MPRGLNSESNVADCVRVSMRPNEYISIIKSINPSLMNSKKDKSSFATSSTEKQNEFNDQYIENQELKARKSFKGSISKLIKVHTNGLIDFED